MVVVRLFWCKSWWQWFGGGWSWSNSMAVVVEVVLQYFDDEVWWWYGRGRRLWEYFHTFDPIQVISIYDNELAVTMLTSMHQ